MPTHKEFTAWITVDGAPLQEFGIVVEEDGRKASCFVPSEAGKKFTMHWRDNGSKTFTAGYIQCDGQIVPGRFLSGVGETFRAGARSGPATERPFMFSDIPKTTSRNVSNAPDAKDVGTIVLKIMQAQRGPPRTANPLQILPSTLSSEWIPTTGGHCATFGKEEVLCPEQSPHTWSSKPVDADYPHSHVKFIFHYRPMPWLQEHGYAPRVLPATPPSTGGRKISFAIPPINLTPQLAPQLYPSYAVPIPMMPHAYAQQNAETPTKKPKGRTASGLGVGGAAKKKPGSRAVSGVSARTASYGSVKGEGEEREGKYNPNIMEAPRAPPPPTAQSQQRQMSGSNQYFFHTASSAGPPGLGRPPLSHRAVSASSSVHARVVSGGSLADYSSDASTDPSPGLKRTHTAPAPAHPTFPTSMTPAYRARTFSTASTSSALSVPGSQGSWAGYVDFDMDDS